MDELKGKAIIVTGAGRGLGAAYARGIAARGGAVVVNDLDGDMAAKVAGEIETAGGRAVGHRADVSNWAEAGALIEACLAAFGTVDGLVNNAGHFAIARLDEIEDDADIRRLVEVNLIGTISCAVHAVRPMLAQGRGSIVNVASGGQMGVPTLSVYGATKGGIATLTYAWAMELKERGIRVNALSPMAVGMMHTQRDNYREARGLPPLGMPTVPPENNTPVVEYLLSDLSAGVTGQVVRMDGDQLGLCTHPAIAMPMLRRDQWNFEAVRDAFASDLEQRQVPLGIVGLDYVARRNPSAFWNKGDEPR